MNRRVKLTAILSPVKCLILIGIIWGLMMAPGRAETIYFQTVGQAGYRVQGSLDYALPAPNLLTLRSCVSSSPVLNLRVNFYDP